MPSSWNVPAAGARRRVMYAAVSPINATMTAPRLTHLENRRPRSGSVTIDVGHERPSVDDVGFAEAFQPRDRGHHVVVRDADRFGAVRDRRTSRDEDTFPCMPTPPTRGNSRRAGSMNRHDQDVGLCCVQGQKSAESLIKVPNVLVGNRPQSVDIPLSRAGTGTVFGKAVLPERVLHGVEATDVDRHEGDLRMASDYRLAHLEGAVIDVGRDLEFSNGIERDIRRLVRPRARK